ncbi:MAG: DUF11 domain-containing protein [Kouleothrix sp.]|nr:DUF11 domain-containing protein [Kouleothrix sp.]
MIAPFTPSHRRWLQAIVITLLCAGLLASTQPARAAALPDTILPGPTNVPIGATFSFSAAFDNSAAADTGYGPFIDLVFPATGADGDDGISFLGATYLGSPVTTVQLTFPAGGCVAHPYAQDTSHAPLQVCGAVGDRLVVLQLPFGSFTPDQPPAAIKVDAALSNRADLGMALTIRARSGFQFGNDALDNPCCDASIVHPASASSTAWPGMTVTPTLLTLSKTYLGPENETASGPNFPRKYRISVDVAEGQTLTNFSLRDVLPNNLQFLGVDSAGGSGTTSVTAISTPSATTPGGTLARRLDKVIGTSGAEDAYLEFSFSVPRANASSAPVIDPVTGDDATSIDDASAQGSWTPIDPRDSIVPIVSDGTPQDHILADKSIAIQKSVAVAGDIGAPGYSVGDTLAYTLTVQISDYFAFENVVISDTLSDGQRFDPAFTPRLSIGGNGFALPAAGMSAGSFAVAPNYTPAAPAPNDGTTTLTFRISDELVSRGQAGRLIGGCVPPGGTAGPAPDCSYDDGATTATLTFHALIQDRFADTFPSGDPYVNSGDHIDNSVTASGDLLSAVDLAPTGQGESDTSGTSVQIVFGTLSKSIYAINGSSSFATPVQVTPGDTVTYRITYDLASSDFEQLQFIDNLPLPIFSAAEITPTLSAAGGIPPAGAATYGPADTYHALSGVSPVTPTVTLDGAENSVTFDYGTFNDPTNRHSTIDLLLSLTVDAMPFADRLFLTNQVHERDGSTNGPHHIADSIAQLQLNEPLLLVKKGAIGSDHAGAALSPPIAGPVAFTPPGGVGPRWAGTISSTNLAAAPIDSNIAGVDAGDLVSFAIVIENTGTSQKGAFDVTITDTLPLGLSIPAGGLNMRVGYGNGAALTYQPLGPSYGAADLFAGGIRLDDPAGTGACQKYDPTDGTNVVVITYDLQVDPGAPANVVIPNRASITNYAGVEGGPNFVPEDRPTDSATTTIALPALAKQLVGTEIVDANNGAAQAVIGELATYRLTLTVPEGAMPNATIVDTLDPGLAFVDVVSATSSAGVTLGGSTAPTIGSAGKTITFNLGAIANSNTDNTIAETITLVYRAAVLDVAGNQSGTQLKNSAALSWSGGSLAPVSAQAVAVIEPALDAAKSVAVNGSGSSGDAGDPVVYTITVKHTAASAADAFDITLLDALPLVGAGGPSLIDSPSFIVTDTAGLLTTADFNLAGSNAAGWTLQTSGSFDMPLAPAGRTITIAISGSLSTSVTPGMSSANTATVRWSSLDGAPGARSIYNAGATERTGGGGVDDYADTGAATLTVVAPSPVKSIVATSEAHTVATGSPAVQRVAIGEIVRYRLVIRLAEGSSPSLTLLDRLDPGLRFLNDGTAKVAFVSNGGGITSSTIAGAGLRISGSSGSVAPTFVLSDTMVSKSATLNDDSYGDGDDVYFKLGNLTNGDSDADGEFVVVELNALVDNISNSQGFNNSTGTSVTTTRNNDFQVLVGGSATPIATSTQDNTNQVRIAEPVIRNLAKTITTTPGDAGDTIAYRLTFSNTASGVNAAAAFEIRLRDTIDSHLAVQTIGVAVPAGSTYADSSVGNALDITVNQLNPGGAVTIDIAARVLDGTPAGQTIPNSASLTYTSLPGGGTGPNPTGSVTPGLGGAADGERGGADGLGGLNDYVSSASATTTLVLPAIDKLTPTPAQYTIGDLVGYDILVTLPEGVSRGLTMIDDLPPGLAYVSHEIVTAAAGSGGLLAADYGGTLASPVVTAPGGSGADLTLGFGDTGTAADNAAANNRFLVRVVARVVNMFPGNQAGATLTNSVSLRYTNPNNGATTSVNDPTPPKITLIEPLIATAKSVVPGAGVQAGDVLTYTARFGNAGGSTAYDVTASDTLAQGTAFTALLGCRDQVGAPVAAAAVDGGTTVDLDSAGAPGGWDIPPGGFVECVYTAAAQSDLYLAGSHANLVDADWSSQDGAGSPEDRIYDDSVPYTVDDVQDSASASFDADGPAFGKSDGGTTAATIGQTIDYTLTITSPLGTLRGLVITDTLPVGLEYEPGSFTVAGISAAPSFTTSGSRLVWDFADAVVTGSPASISFQTTVANLAANQQGAARDNLAVLSYRGADGAARPALSASDAFAIVEPALAIDKVVSQPSAAPGSVATFRVTLTNPSAATAYDVAAADTLPAGLAYIGPLRWVSGPAPVADDSGAPLLRWSYAALAPGQAAVVEFDARLDGPGAIINDAGVTWTSRPGACPDERTGADGVGGALNDYAATDSATLLTSAYALSKTLAAPLGGPAGLNDTVRFSIVVTNTGATTLPTVPLTDAYDLAYLTYLGASPASDDNIDDGLIGWSNVGPLVPGATKTIDVRFKARALTGALPGGVTLNRAGASGLSDGYGTALPGQGDGATVAIGPRSLAFAKSDGGASSTPGGTAIYTLAYTNTGEVELTGVTLTETVPANTTFRAAGSTSGWSCADGAPAGTICTHSIGALAAGASGTATFAVTVDTPLPAGISRIDNSATIGDDRGTTAEGSDSTPVITRPGLSLSKSDGGATTTPGGTVIYTLGYTNTGDVGLAGVSLTETVPANTTFRAAGSTSGWSCADRAPAGTSCTLSIGALASGVSGAATFVVAANNTMPAGVTQISNSATIDDPSGATASSGDTTPLSTTPGLSLVKSDGGSTTRPGGTIAYSLTYRNTGDVELTGVTLTETVPAHTRFAAAASASGWSCADGAPAGTICVLPVGTLAAGAGGSVTFAVVVDGGVSAGTSQIDNSVAIADDGGTTAEGSDSTPVITTPSLSLDKSDGGTTTTPGGTIAYSLSYRNSGNVGLTGVTLTETVPANTTFRAAGSTSGWSCADGALAGTSCALSIGALDVGASGSAVFGVTVDTSLPAGVSEIDNGATIADDGDTTAGANDNTPVITTPGLLLSKSDGGATTTPGGTVIYTLGYTNTGNIGLSGVQIDETVPANTTFRTAGSTPGWSCADGALAGTSCTLSIGALNASASGTATFAITVAGQLPAGVVQVANSATIVDGGGQSAGNSDTTPVIATPGLLLSKSDGGAATTPGGTVIYTLGYTNTGNIGLSGVQIEETVPAYTRFSASASTPGWSCADRALAGTSCTLSIGTLTAGTGGTATFTVTVDGSVPTGTTRIANSATIAADDGTAASASDTTPVATTPGLSLAKSDGGITTAPGGTVVYSLTYQNTGDVDLDGVVIGEVVPSNSRFAAAGSASGWSCADRAPAGTGCALSIGTLAAGAGGTVSFAVSVDRPIATGAAQIANSATIADDGGTTAEASDSTPVIASPRLAADKRVLDLDGSPTVAGDLLEYTIVIQNSGDTAATGVSFSDAIPAHTSYITGSTTLNGEVVADVDGVMPFVGGAPINTPGEPSGEVAAGETATVVFRVKIDDPLPADVLIIRNQGTVESEEAPPLWTDDPSTPAIGDPTDIGVAHPTAIVLVSFTATRENHSVVVRWATGAELNTWGFHLYRSPDGVRAHATRVTPQIILGVGRGQGGASYSWADANVEDAATYSYWLSEIELGGATNEYGPATTPPQPASGTYRLLVPLMLR